MNTPDAHFDFLVNRNDGKRMSKDEVAVLLKRIYTLVNQQGYGFDGGFQFEEEEGE